MSEATAQNLVAIWGQNDCEIIRILFSHRPYRYAPSQEHVAFLRFTPQTANAYQQYFAPLPWLSQKPVDVCGQNGCYNR